VDSGSGWQHPRLAAEPRVILADEPVSMLDVDPHGYPELMGRLRDEENIAFSTLPTIRQRVILPTKRW
jgi:ABC-type phosphate transport system ATPase subunit